MTKDAAMPVRDAARNVRSYIESMSGSFSVNQVYRALGYSSRKERGSVYSEINRLHGKVIEPDPTGPPGIWRKIVRKRDVMFLSEVSLRLPLRLNDCAAIYPGNMIIIAGTPGSGKSAFMLRVIRDNMDTWKTYYFNSGMGAPELLKRLDMFSEGFPISHENFIPCKHHKDFDGVIEPGEGNLNVIDCLELPDNFYMAGDLLNRIYRRLEGASAVIAIKPGDDRKPLPLGMLRAFDKPNLVVSLTGGDAMIIKCNDRRTNYNIDGYRLKYELANGCEFTPLTRWQPLPDWVDE